MAGSSCGFPRTEECSPRQSDHCWHKARALQSRIVHAKATIVFRKANIHQLAHVDIGAELAGASHGEVVVLYAIAHIGGYSDALPDEEGPDGENLEFEPRPAP